MPLHKPAIYLQYHQMLWDCIIKIIHQMPLIADEIIKTLLKYWPKTESVKEIMFLTEVEKIIESTLNLSPETLIPLFKQISLCISSANSRVSCRGLLLWENERVASLILNNVNIILPHLFTAIYNCPSIPDDHL